MSTGERWTPVRSGLVVAAVVCSVFVAQVLLVLRATGGAFTYTLDDPYIHLALAEQISHGHYGINPDEASSPSSSVLWPFLLAVTARLPFQDWIPLVWALLATIGSTAVLLALYARVAPRLAAVMLTAVTVMGLNLIGVAFTGMEHSLQVFLALLVGYGMVGAVQDRQTRVPWWLGAAMIVGPLVRYENAAVSVAAAFVLALRGRRAAAVLTGSWVALLGLFSGFLLTLGLDPLPSSILAKSAYGGGGSLLEVMAERVEAAVTQPTMAAAALILALDAVLARRWGLLHWFIAMVLGAHAVAGDFGWLSRYELYMLAAVLPPLVTLAAQWRARRGVLGAVVAGAAGLMAVTSVVPLVETTLRTAAASADIASQQAQTALFVSTYWRRPIAVNDLGLVAYRGGQPVLDLWGLASQDAREARLGGGDWVVEVLADDDVELMAVYSSWFAGQIPDDWTPVGSITGREPVASASRQVDFYAADSDTRDVACAALKSFSSSVPSETVVTVAEC